MRRLVKVLHCDSCGYGYTTGHGVANDWFCSERCREWFDRGEPNYYQQQQIAANAERIVFPSMRTKSDEKKKLENLVDCLDCSLNRIKSDVIEGRRGRMRVDDGKVTLIADHVTKRKLSSLKKQLSFMTHDGHQYETERGYSGKWSMSDNPTPEQAKVIRKVVGLKRSSISS